MSQLRPIHRCQIDCTNHDEVINNLELKSKDLYYFWRNYEWLYTKYEQLLLKEKEVPEPQRQPQIIKEIVKIKENHDKCNHQIQELENHKQRLQKQNKNLRKELDSSKKQIQQLQNNNKYEVQYKKQITFLKNKSAELQGIIDKQLGEITKLKSQRKNIEEEYDNEKIRLNKQSKKLKQTIIQLEQRLDQLRNKSVPNVSHPPSKQDGLTLLQLEEFKSRQTTILSSKLSLLSQQAEKLISIQCDSMKRQFQQQLQDALLSMSQRQLNTIIQFIQQ